MRPRHGHRSTAIVGTAFAALFIGVFATSGETPEETAPLNEIIVYYQDHATQLRVGAFVIVTAAVMLLFFAGGLREALSGDEPDDRLSTVAYGGAVACALALGVMALVASAAASAVDSPNPDTVAALNVLDNQTFLPVMIGLSATLLATGLRALRTGALPRWLAWASVVLGVLAPAGPGGFAAFFAFPFWVVAVGVVLARRAADATPASAASRVLTAAQS